MTGGIAGGPRGFNRIILTANPSFATPVEAQFWRHFDRVCEREGWRLFKHSMRRIPEDPRTMILPARLTDVSGFLRNPPEADTGGALPAWLQRADHDTIVEWEHRRWELLAHEPKIALGLWRLAWHVDAVFRFLRPAGTIVSNKIDHGTALFYWAANHYGSKAVFFERSPLETFIAEDRGMFAESEIWRRFPAEADQDRAFYDDVGTRMADFLGQNTDGFRKQEFGDREARRREIRALPQPRVFLPMDNILWTGWAQEGHWQGTIDHFPGTPDPSAAIDRLARIVGAKGGSLIVKKHPSDVQAYRVSEPNVTFLDAPLELLIRETDATVAFLTKVAFVSTAIGKPTVVLAPNTVAAAETCFLARAPEDWDRVLSEALAAGPDDLAAKRAALVTLLGWLDRCFYIDPRLPADLAKPSAATLFHKTASGPVGLAAGLSPSAIDSLIGQLTRSFANRHTWMKPGSATDGAVGILYDVSRLANTRLQHSGISRFTAKTLALLRQRPGVRLRPVLAKPEVLDRGEFKGRLADFSASLGGGLLLPDQIDQVTGDGSWVYFSPYDELPDLPGPAIPRIVTVHDVLHITASEWYIDPKARAQIDQVLARIRPEDHVVVVSEFTRSQLLRVKGLAPEKVETVHLAADPAFRRANDAEVAAFRAAHGLGTRSYFVLFGQFEFRKNVPTMLSAVRAFIADSTTEARFVVVGSALGANPLRAALATAGIPPDRITFLAEPSDEEMALAYSGATAMLYVSLAEGFGLPIIEAMRCGCPVITSAVTSIPEVAGDGAWYVDPYSPGQMLAAMKALERAPTLVGQLREAALRKASGFDWHRTAEAIVQVARNALAGAADPGRATAATPRIIDPAVFDALAAQARDLEEELEQHVREAAERAEALARAQTLRREHEARMATDTAERQAILAEMRALFRSQAAPDSPKTSAGEDAA